MPFFGELYLESTLPYLSAQSTRAEADYLERVFSNLPPPGPIVDIGCGHGRHASILNSAPGLRRRIVGLELDETSLALREPGFEAVRADFRRLPFLDQSLAGMFAWYSTPFIFSDRENELALREFARCLKAGGRLVIQTTPYDRLTKRPHAAFEGTVPSGAWVSEQSSFDPGTGRDHIFRTVVLPDGRRLSGDFFIRYYPSHELQQLVEGVGFVVEWIHGNLSGDPVGAESTDLIIGVRRDG